MWPQNVCGGRLTADPSKPKLGGLLSNLAELSSVFPFSCNVAQNFGLIIYACQPKLGGLLSNLANLSSVFAFMQSTKKLKINILYVFM